MKNLKANLMLSRQISSYESLTLFSVSYQYDANGSQIKKTEGAVVTDYVYNGENRLAQVKQGTTTIASYYHDPFGRRLSKTVGGITTYSYYAQEGLVAEADSTGTVKVHYGYTPDGIWGTDPLYLAINGNYHYYLNDHLGTPQQLAQKNGAQGWAAIYEAFGKATVTNSTITNNLRFPGQYEDAETGYHYNFQRIYDNQVGRYVKSDPIGLLGGYNDYVYASGNPILRADAHGLFYAQLIGFGIGAGFELYNQVSANGWENLDYRRIAVSGLTGALGGFAKGVISGASIGAFGGGFNNAYQQLSGDKCFDVGEVVISAVGGAFGGGVGVLGQRIGQGIQKSGGYGNVFNINHPELNTYYSVGNYGNYGNYGAAVGGAYGTYQGNQYANQ